MKYLHLKHITNSKAAIIINLNIYIYIYWFIKNFQNETLILEHIGNKSIFFNFIFLELKRGLQMFWVFKKIEIFV